MNSPLSSISAPLPATSPLRAQHGPYFTQAVEVSQELVGVPRVRAFQELLAGKSVLHVGYADWPITDVSQNLHVVLDGVCAVLDGVDPHDEADAVLRPHVRGRLMRTLSEVDRSYDVVLVPEVLEHVDNLADFLHELDTIEFEAALITVPDAYSCFARHFDFEAATSTVVEVVHPDHNVWFTPYTFSNLIRKYTPWRIDGLWFFNGISLLMLATRRP